MRMHSAQNRPRPGIYLLPGMLAALLAAAIWTMVAAGGNPSGNAMDQVLQEAVDRQKIPGIVAMVAEGDHIIYQGAAGQRDTTKNIHMTVDTIFRMASMTKAITSASVLQLLENGRVKLDEPVTTYLPELAQLQVLEDFDAGTGKAKLRSPKTIPSIRQLLTHTSGYAYGFDDAKLDVYLKSPAFASLGAGDDDSLKEPLLFDPGSRWEYGISTDVLGKLVEKISGQTLEAYFHEHIFQPLGMTDTFFDVPAEKQARVVALHQRQQGGSFVEPPQRPFTPRRFYSGGGGLYSTAGDYLKFELMVLGAGKLGNARILRSETVEQMSRNQIGDLTLTQMPSTDPELAANPIHIPGSLDKFGLGFAINSKPVAGGRSAGSLAWAGIYNTYFWIDPHRKTCAVILMQILPFSDDQAISTVERFERAVYATPVARRTSAGAELPLGNP